MQGKGKGKGGKLNYGPWEPPIHARFRFMSYRHAFYDYFPDGSEVDAVEAGVNYDGGIVVLQLQAADIPRTIW